VCELARLLATRRSPAMSRTVRLRLPHTVSARAAIARWPAEGSPATNALRGRSTSVRRRVSVDDDRLLAQDHHRVDWQEGLGSCLVQVGDEAGARRDEVRHDVGRPRLGFMGAAVAAGAARFVVGVAPAWVTTTVPAMSAAPVSWPPVRDWSRTAQPRTVATSGLNRPRKLRWLTGSRSIPRNHSR
jgi:hypothetical protein